MFATVFPTPTAGDGLIKRISSGAGQGRGSMAQYAHCKQCGYRNDVRKIDISGGSEASGDGAVTGITKTTLTGTTLGGDTFSDSFGQEVIAQGGGCAFCGSKNSVNEKPFAQVATKPFPR